MECALFVLAALPALLAFGTRGAARWGAVAICLALIGWGWSAHTSAGVAACVIVR